LRMSTGELLAQVLRLPAKIGLGSRKSCSHELALPRCWSQCQARGDGVD
jgi:hypothetical protein